MKTYSLAIAWNWEYDEDFIRIIEGECQQRGMTVLNLQPSNLADIFPDIVSGRILFRSLYDRASDDDESFLSLVKEIEHRDILVINPHRYVDRAKDKAAMHPELISAGLQVPYTIIIPSYSEEQYLSVGEAQLEKLGKPFIIKPAKTTGGGTGVILHATSMEDILNARQNHKDDKYLLQEHIHPAILGGKRAWFREFYVFGEIIHCWWDDVTHVYRHCSPEDENRYELSKLCDIMKKVQSRCHLDFFSSEIAFTSNGKFVIIDYVNEICDMRLQSRHADGVPDYVVQKIARSIAEHIFSSELVSEN